MDSEKFAASLARYREHALMLESKRPCTKMTAYVPPHQEVKTKVAGPQCSARTLEGRQCPFNAAPECSGFCKKHFSMI